jgi:hypothetical protein
MWLGPFVWDSTFGMLVGFCAEVEGRSDGLRALFKKDRVLLVLGREVVTGLSGILVSCVVIQI